jgi:hypothetical protein
LVGGWNESTVGGYWLRFVLADHDRSGDVADGPVGVVGDEDGEHAVAFVDGDTTRWRRGGGELDGDLLRLLPFPGSRSLVEVA